MCCGIPRACCGSGGWRPPLAAYCRSPRSRPAEIARDPRRHGRGLPASRSMLWAERFVGRARAAASVSPRRARDRRSASRGRRPAGAPVGEPGFVRAAHRRAARLRAHAVHRTRLAGRPVGRRIEDREPARRGKIALSGAAARRVSGRSPSSPTAIATRIWPTCAAPIAPSWSTAAPRRGAARPKRALESPIGPS